MLPPYNKRRLGAGVTGEEPPAVGDILPPYSRRSLGPGNVFKFEPTQDGTKSEWTKAASGTAIALPFTIQDVSPDATTPKINVLFGTVTDITPTNIATDIALTSTATNTIYLDVTIDADGIPTAAALLVATTGLPADTDTHAYKLVGTAIVDGAGLITTINQSLYFSQGFQACGRDPADPTTTPGTYMFFVD